METNLDKEALRSHERRDKEVISDIETFRKTMEGFWHRVSDTRETKASLDFQKNKRSGDLLAAGYEMTAYLERDKEEEHGEPFRLDNLVIASQNEKKRAYISEAASLVGVDIKEIALGESLGSEEEETHKILRQLIKERSDHERKGAPMEPTMRHYVPALYALDVAEQKMRKVEHKQEDKSIPIIACDVVVLLGERILEKPKDRKEALVMLKKLSGKEIEISLAATLLTPSSMGRIFLREAARMKVSLRHFTESDIEKYLDDAGDRYLGVAGAIDYANPAAKVFLDDTVPASIEKIEDLRRGTRMGGKSALFSPALLGQMEDYAAGVPRELIQSIINQGKALAA